ncbi:MAG: sulfatase [Bacteroidales bacterium]|nr:sulfatase [Bacteroidales bacterium]
MYTPLVFQRKSCIFGIAVLALFTGIACKPVNTETRELNPLPKSIQPNIIWIVGENLNLDLGIYGEKLVATPNLDSLGKNGMVYTHVFSTSPVCAPSRSAFMTGMYQTTTGTHNMRSHRKDDYRLPDGVRPVTHRLADAGYYTANITSIGDRIVGTGKLDLNFVNEGPIYDSDNWSTLKSNQPFFATINTPEIEYDIYDRQTFSKERVEWVGEKDHPQIATPENVPVPPYYPDQKITRQELARYYNSVSGMDIRVGHILEQLQKEGLDEHTVIIFFGDNGRLDARGIHWCWDTGLRVPMIVYWPEKLEAPPQYQAGTVSDQIISLLDITATTLQIAGIPRPLSMQSRVFLGEHADRPRTYAFSARDRIDETVNRIRSVREERYHYMRNFMPGQGFTSLNRYKEKCFAVKPLMRELHAAGQLTGAAAELMEPLPYEQLYDTWSDPHEIYNLAESDIPEHQAALHRLRAALDTWIAETGDQGEWPEPEEIIVPFEKEMHDWFGTPEWYYNSVE